MLEQQLKELRRLVFGAKSERYVPSEVPANQLNIFTGSPDAEVVLDSDADTAQQDTVVRTRKVIKKPSKHKGRSLLDGLQHLPTEETIYDEPPTADSICIGQHERATLAYTPGIFHIRKEITKKYKNPATGRITSADLPAQPIDRCEADISLLSHICVAKHVDHLPEYRQVQMYKRDGVSIPTSTINDWVQQTARLLQPMADHIGAEILHSGYIMVDESTIKVLKTKRNKAHTGWMWLIYSPGLQAVRFMYHHGRTHDIPHDLLKNYQGHFQTDGYAAYDAIEVINSQADHSSCNAHARRYFDKALDNDSVRAEHAMQVYHDLYKVERQLRTYRENHPDLCDEDYYAYRQEQRKQVLPVLEQYKKWLEKQAIEVLPKSPIGRAIKYVLKRWTKLTKYATNGMLEIDNNLIENVVRPLALGRKNYLFAGSEKGAEHIAVFQTIFGTCKHLGINPIDYLTWYLQNVAHTNINQIATLSPWQYQDTIKKSNTLLDGC